MNEEALNRSIRKFLKNVGVTSQREIEIAVRKALADGRIKGSESMPVKATVHLGHVGLDMQIEGTIDLA